jgi:hypothetical protein
MEVTVQGVFSSCVSSPVVIVVFTSILLMSGRRVEILRCDVRGAGEVGAMSHPSMTPTSLLSLST